MYCTQRIETGDGEVIFGFVGLKNELHVKLIAAHIAAAPERFRDIQNIPLVRARGSEFVIPVIDHRYYDDFAKLVHRASKKIDWKLVENELYTLHVAELDTEIASTRSTISAAQERLMRLENGKDVARTKAESGLLHQALSYLQNVILRLT